MKGKAWCQSVNIKLEFIKIILLKQAGGFNHQAVHGRPWSQGWCSLRLKSPNISKMESQRISLEEFFPVGNRDGWVSFFHFEGIPISNVSHYLRCGVSESLQQRLRFGGKSHSLKQHQSSTLFKFPGWNGWNDWNGWNGENLPFPSLSILFLIKQTTCSGVVIFPDSLWWQESDPEPAEPPVVNVVDVGSTVSSGESNAARDEDGMAYVSFWVWCQRLKHWEKMMADEFDHRIMSSNWAVFWDLNCETVELWSGEVLWKESRSRHDSTIYILWGSWWLVQFFQPQFFRKVPHQGHIFRCFWKCSMILRYAFCMVCLVCRATSHNTICWNGVKQTHQYLV